jgi:hypothetical protein
MRFVYILIWMVQQRRSTMCLLDGGSIGISGDI